MKMLYWRIRDCVPWRVFTLSFFVLASFMILPSTYCQTYYSNSSYPPEKFTNNNHLRLNEVNRNAARHFRDHFLENGAETWVKEKGFYIASFNSGPISNKVYYNPKGAYKCTVKVYGEESLDKGLSANIRKRFPGYNIRIVMEINNLENSLYFIKIANNKFIKSVRCLDGNIEVTDNLINGGI